ncbi:uncharacterized protein KQ657_000042 [Scheffersomyces spartinae]|uniref:DNA repair metallo-beta-lactamase domain-containing protein n=1 Tax=Scheffersomyces spartinae TaxID=45513 RepID=A0A9P7VDU3_9ASCO|nr:uncharacterized protein KQ657_000042 [Scheffersomyces spartinae]KAG7196034.1 hypothetical protein KQ657_000042 [Scheffersomyces spartinae]
MPPKVSQTSAKRQGNVLDLLKRPQTSYTIDLTEEDDNSQHQQVKDEIDQDHNVASVLCPICEITLDTMTMDVRVRHVESCMSVIAISELSQVTSIKADSELTPVTSIKMDNDGGKKIPTTPKKPKLDRERYVNSNVSVLTESKVIKVPSKVIQQKPHKRPIPQLKIMTFPKLDDNSESSSFQVAVDAFSYAIHENIDKYFLTHFHADHYGGISRNWCFQRVFEVDETDFSDDSRFKKIIYCTPITSRLLSLKFGIDLKFIQVLELDTRYFVHSYEDSALECHVSPNGIEPGLYVTPLSANHCPGAAIFLMESVSILGDIYRILHCGDFRVSKEMIEHPVLRPYSINQRELRLDKVYLDTTYLDPDYSFPKQENVCKAVADMFEDLILNQNMFTYWFGTQTQSRITDFIALKLISQTKLKKKKFLILVGTYLIGKERIAMAILKRLKCQIFVLCINGRREKLEIVKSFEDDYLSDNLTMDDIGLNDGPEAQGMVHLVPMKIVSSMEEMANYFHHNKYFEYFEMCVGLKPSGWTFKNMYVKTDTPMDLEHIITSMALSPPYTFMENILPQIPPPVEKSSNKRKQRTTDPHYRIYTVPYSEHSSFRELCYFCTFLQIGEVIPTVNTESSSSRERMQRAIDLWELIRELKNGNGGGSNGIEPSLIQSIKDLSLNSF